MAKAGNKKEEVDVLIISDIHLGSGLSMAGKLVSELKKYKFKKLILNGDIFDGLNFKRLHSGHWAVLSMIRKLSKKGEVIWIIGNHDGTIGALSQLIGVKVYRQYIWRNNGNKFLAIHGHQFDRFLHKNILLSGTAIFAYNLIQKVSGQNEAVSHWLKNRSKSWLRLSGEVADGAIKYAKLKGADFVFCGHTHAVNEKKRWGIKYYNSGSWVESPASYIIIKGNKIEIKKV